MRYPWTSAALMLAIATFPLTPAIAQQADSSSGETAAETEAAVEDLLTNDELDELVAPIALFPDTLLIQILVASTYPLEVIKAQQWLEKNEGLSQEEMSAGIQQEDWDPSVQVLTEAFPDVLTRMADNIDWTELAGSAMLVQSEDVMASVQRMRETAIDVGSLQDTPEQVVARDETNAVTILPADPEVIYVPQYKTETVYVSDTSNNNNNNDALLFFGSAILIAAIIDNNNYNNYWGGYWGCRNCGGWNGRPVHYRGGDIDINGNVNIGNDINIGNQWKPNNDRRKRGQDQIRDHKDRGGLQNRPGKVPGLNDRPSRGDQMRRDLGAQTGARDISRPENRDAARQVSRDRAQTRDVSRDRPQNKGVAKRPTASKKKAIAPSKAKARPATQKRAAAPQQRKNASRSGAKQYQSGNRARSSASRGGGSRSKGGGRRR